MRHLILITLCCLGIAGARADSSILQQARIALAQGDAAAARRLITQINPYEIADQRLYLFVQARIWMALGHFDLAIPILKQILNEEPHLVRVRLELARCFFEIGDDDNAKRQFERAAVGQLEPAVLININRFLGAIQKRRIWHSSFSLGFSEDDNLNRATSRRTVSILGLPFIVSENARPTSGTGVNLYGMVSARPRLKGHQLNIATQFWINDYPSRDFDNQTLEIHLAYRWVLPNGEIDLGPLFVPRWRGGQSYGTDSGASLRADLRFGRRWLFDGRLEGVHHDLSSHFDSAYEGHSGRLHGRLRYFLAPQKAVGIFGTRSWQTLRRPWLDYNNRGLGLEYYTELPFGITIRLRGARDEQKNKRAHPFFPVARRDTTYRRALTLGLRRFSVRDFYPSIIFNRDKRESNIGIYDYRSNAVTLTFIRRF